jgi:hypothetical protein
VKRRVLACGALGGALAALTIFACSLGLDESKIGQVDAASPPVDAPAQETAVDAPSDGPPPIMPEGGVCTKDEDCMGASDTCEKPRCDVPRKACVVDVCKPAACMTSACDTMARTCAAPKTHKFLAAQFPVGAGVGCGSVRSCFAAVYPYVFVGTPNGVVAFSGDDPGNVTPTPVPVTGLAFVPVQVVASGSRVFFLGAASGSGMATSSRVQIAWIDVPPDPFRKSLAVSSVLATYNRPTSEVGFSLGLFTRANDTALLIDYNAAQSFPCTAVEPPLLEPVSLGSTPIPFTTGTVPEIESGTRLVMASFDGNAGTGSFGLMSNAGGSPATNGGQVAVPATMGMPATPFFFNFPSSTFAVDPQGGVAWIVESVTQAPNNPAPPGSLVKSVKTFFLLADGAANFDFTQSVDIETYNTVPPGPPPVFGQGAALIGPAAMIDTNTALVTTADKNNAAQTNVQLVTKMPLGLVAGKKQPITTNAVGSLAASASGGYGYVLASETATASSVYVFDPACAP